MAETIVTYALAGLLGFVIAKVLHRLLPQARVVRILILLSLPVTVLLAAFLVFFDAAPQGDDWIWFFIGLVYFWPWYLTWIAGCGLEKLTRPALARSFKRG